LLDFKIAEREARALIPPGEIEWQAGLESYIYYCRKRDWKVFP
jgi:hypothetical protein